ncbi:CBS domain-containing protein [candidate division KSB1 bacterium]|nr:CBS domain-containing protein [candidate division KSB1 bacterium]
MNVDSILKTKGNVVVTVAPGEKISVAAAKLKREKIGALVVSEDGIGVSGILSERDIARALADHGAGLGELAVGDLMTRNVITCTPDDTVEELMTTMTEHRIRHLPVMVDGALCGIISIGDMVKNRLEEIQRETESLRAYIAGA